MNSTNNRRPLNMVLMLAALLLASWASQAQVTLLDAASHDKFFTEIPKPGRIDVTNGAYIPMEMREVTQNLGLYVNGDKNGAKLWTKVWGYGRERGTVTYPGPTFLAMKDEAVDIKWTNNLPNEHLLPVDESLHWAAPPNYPRNGQPTVVHLHGGHTESASDGLPEAWYTRRFRDRGPTWVKKVYHYDNDQEAATLWYHDHALGITRLNVYAGLAGFYLLRDDNENGLIEDEVLPGGDFEREIVVQDHMFTSDGAHFLPSKTGDPWFGDPDDPLTLPLDPSVVAEFFGNFILVNGVAWPKMTTKQTKYRLRMLNGSDSRFYVFYLEKEGNEGTKEQFMQIGTDDGLLESPVPIYELVLAPGERADIVVDFSGYEAGDRILMKNRGPDEPFRGIYPAGHPLAGGLKDGEGGLLDEADEATTGKIMAFDIVGGSAPSFSVNTGTTLRDPIMRYDEGDADNVRKVAFFEGMDALGRLQPLLGVINGDLPKSAGPLNGSLAWFEPITENPMLNDVELWEAYNLTEDAHPMHLHLVSFQILDRVPIDAEAIGVTPQPQVEHHTAHTGMYGTGGYVRESDLAGNVDWLNAEDPAPNEDGWKDTFILPPGYMARVIAKFDRPGRYVWHCHILSHEDHEMMRPYEVVEAVPRPAVPVIEDFAVAEATLAPSFPNPSTGPTTIPFFLPTDEDILLTVMDFDGKVVKQLAFGHYPAGNHTVEWDGTNSAGTPVASGVYIYQLNTSDNVYGQQMIIQR